MRCPRCEADTHDGAKFFIECGAALNLRCPQRGPDVRPRAKLCAKCGMPLTGQNLAPPSAPSQPPLRYTPGYLAEKILHSRSALQGERKQVTVLSADLKGSMELLADRGPEDARAILDPVLKRMMAAVRRYEGTVNQVNGTDYDTLSCVDAPRRNDVTLLKPTSCIPFGDNSAPRGDQDHRCMNCHVNPGLGCGWGSSTPRTIHGDDVRYRLHIGQFEGITTRDVHAGPA